MEADVITLQDIYEFKVDSIAADRTIIGALRPTGLRPTLLVKFDRRGVTLPNDFFIRTDLPRTTLADVTRGSR
jgi:hypothetical protein